MPISRWPAPARREFLGLDFADLTTDQVIALLRARRPEDAFDYVVTPNVDHVVRLSRMEAGAAARLRRAYAQAFLCLCDSRILARLAAWRGVALPVVPGSELTARLFAEVIGDGDRIAVVGASREVMAVMRGRFPTVDFRHHEPPMGLLGDEPAMAIAARFAATCDARLTFIAVGSPQQELLALAVASLPGAQGTGLCVGASVEFISGHQRRAPVLLQRLSLEWAFRLASDPRRLWRRYVVEGPRIFLLARRWKPRV